MDRGPVALFAAIVAVGLGPAMWLGAQFGNIEIAPTGPPAAVEQQTTGTQRMLGGAGAGDSATGDDTVIRTDPKGHVRPLTRSPSASPSVSRSPSPSGSSSPSPSADPSASSGTPVPPTESSSSPAGEPSDSGEPPVPPSSSASDDSGDPANPEKDGGAIES
jgi:hypothetical protein